MTETQRTWTARIVMAVPVLFLLFDATIKLVKIQAVTDAMAALGYPDGLARVFGVLLLLLVVVAIAVAHACVGGPGQQARRQRGTEQQDGAKHVLSLGHPSGPG